MQCHAMSCRTPHPIPAHSETGEKVGIQTRKKREQKRNKSSILLALARGRTPPSSIPSHPIHKTPPKQTITSYQREKEKPQKPRLRKVAPVFKKRPSHSARSSRKQSTQVTPTMMPCLEATGSTAERLRAHAADTAAGLAHTGLALSAAPAGR